MRTLVLGAGGQVGRALVAALPDATAVGRDRLDLGATDAAELAALLAGHDVVINAAAWTDVDGAETVEGRRAAWAVNATGPAVLAAAAAAAGTVLVHFSTEYVFDGHAALPYREDAPVAPLSAYGAAKAAGDLAVAAHPRHYLVRPTWVVGQGRNFVATMIGLAGRGISPTVVADQVGRPTFADDLAAAVLHLLRAGADFGTYHVTSGGEPASWAEVARAVFAAVGRDDLTVTDTTTAEYFAGRAGVAPRPLNSVLDLGRAQRAGVALPEWRERLARYVRTTQQRA